MTLPAAPDWVAFRDQSGDGQQRHPQLVDHQDFKR